MLGHFLHVASSQNHVAFFLDIYEQIGRHPPVDMTAAVTKAANLPGCHAETFPAYEDFHIQPSLVDPRADFSPGGNRILIAYPANALLRGDDLKTGSVPRAESGEVLGVYVSSLVY